MAVNEDWRSEGLLSQTSSHYSEVMDVPIVYSPLEEVSNPIDCVRELLWDQTDQNIMRAVNKVASDVFKHVSVRKRRDVLTCGIKSLLRTFRTRWP